MTRPIAAIDLDETLLQWEGWQGIDRFGPPYPQAKDFLEKLHKHFDILIYTTRCSTEVMRLGSNLLANKVREFLTKENLPFDDIWVGQGKPLATVFIDDRAVNCRPSNGNDPEKTYEAVLEQSMKIAIRAGLDKDHIIESELKRLRGSVNFPTTTDWAEAIASRIADESSYDYGDSAILEKALTVALSQCPDAVNILIGTGIIEESYFDELSKPAKPADEKSE